MKIELSPAGIGTDRVLTNWRSFVRHVVTPCDACLPLEKAVRHRPEVPAQLVNACCQQGQVLDACADLVEHFTALT